MRRVYGQQSGGLKGKKVTQSGQEPPGNGRDSADGSGNSAARIEPGGKPRRRRKRRPRGRTKAKFAGQQNPVESGEKVDSGDKPVDSVDGLAQSELAAQTPCAANAAEAAPRDKRRRRRKKKASPPAQASGDSLSPSQPVGLSEDRADTATSAKGKRAARRRGRKRWKGNAANGDAATSAVTTDQNNGPGQDVKKAADKVGRASAVRDQEPAGTRSVRGGYQKRARRPASDTGSNLYAALDLGTNNCRLLIARPEERGFRVVDAYSRIVRLGEGVGSNRRLSDAAMDRAIEALANCHHKLVERGVDRSRLIATEACRAAENGEEFINRVKSETGLGLEIVNRETEARLAVAGCASLVDHQAAGVILFDIGGGSSEIVWLDLRNRCGARGYALTRFIRSWISLPVGVVNLAERHGGVDVTHAVFEAMVDDAAGHLSSFSLSDTLTEAIASGGVHMLGTSGTVTTLAGVHLGLKRYDRRRVDGAWLEDGEVSGMIDQLRGMSYEARVENPCIGADRADLVLAGCAILEAIRRRWSCSRLRVADRGLREGILTELMAADGVWSRKKAGRASAQSRRRNRT